MGAGPLDLVLVPGWLSNVELMWEEPTMERLLDRLASFTRLILFDKRGTGLSDRIGDLPDIETRMVLVSSTVKDLVAGSGLAFEERGAHALKGVPGEWRLFAAFRSGSALTARRPRRSHGRPDRRITS